jgi:replicative DNA helicase
MPADGRGGEGVVSGPDHGMKLPPQNLEAEMCTLGSLLLDNEAFHEVLPLLRPADFYRDSHQELYRAMADLFRDGGAVDAITLVEELARRKLFEKVGGDEGIRRILEAPPHAANARYYAQIVRQKATSRGIVEAAHRMLRDGYSNDYSADELVARAEADLASVSDGRDSRELSTLADAGRESLRRFDLRLAGEETGVFSGLSMLDEMTSGFRPAQLVVLGARPGQGKTSLALCMAEHVAALYGPVLFSSLEMGLAELGDRAVCGRAGVDSDDYRKATEAARRKRAWIERKVAEMEGLPVYVDDTPGVTPGQVTATARRMRRKKGLSLVIVDYLQIMGSDDRKASEYDRVGKAATAMKNLSKLVEAPVLALSQLSRKCEERTDKRPIMSDLRATGQIEQDADLILFLYRPEYYARGDRPGVAEINIAKQRDGATGTVEVAFDNRRTRFSDLVPNFNAPPGGGPF